MHLRNVELFCDVVAHRSFSKAALANNVSQSSASQAVHMLEKRLGSKLIDRSKRPLELTPAGKVYFDGCRNLLDSFREIEDTVQRMGDKVVGRVRVAAIYSVGLLQMNCYRREYRQRYPDVELRLDYLHPDEVYARVLEDEADLGMVSFPRDGGEISCIPWQDQPMHLVVYPEHPLAHCSSVSTTDLIAEDLVSFCSELKIRRQLDRWLKRAQVVMNVVHEFDNIENIKRAVEIGSGAAILPAATVHRESEVGSLKSLPIRDADWTRPLGIIHRRHKALSLAAKKFVELLHEDPLAFPLTARAQPSDHMAHHLETMARPLETVARPLETMEGTQTPAHVPR